MDQWIVVVDGDEVSERQMEVCRALRPALHGAVKCHLPENADAEVCKDVRYFPAFCNTQTNECVYGLRNTTEDFHELTLATNASQRTTAPTEPPRTPPQ